MTGPLRLAPIERTAERDGVMVTLPPDAMLVLELFAYAPGRVITRRHMLERVFGSRWRGRATDARWFNLTLHHLRKHTEPLGFFIEPVGDIGFIMRDASCST